MFSKDLIRFDVYLDTQHNTTRTRTRTITEYKYYNLKRQKLHAKRRRRRSCRCEEKSNRQRRARKWEHRPCSANRAFFYNNYVSIVSLVVVVVVVANKFALHSAREPSLWSRRESGRRFKLFHYTLTTYTTTNTHLHLVGIQYKWIVLLFFF